MLQSLIDLVDLKVSNINEFIFYDTRYQRSSSGTAFQNYFDLLNSEYYSNQVEIIQKALNHFLNSISMLIFVNICQIEEITDFEISEANKMPHKKKKKDLSRTIETIYINKGLDKLENEYIQKYNMNDDKSVGISAINMSQEESQDLHQRRIDEIS